MRRRTSALIPVAAAVTAFALTVTPATATPSPAQRVAPATADTALTGLDGLGGLGDLMDVLGRTSVGARAVATKATTEATTTAATGPSGAAPTTAPDGGRRIDWQPCGEFAPNMQCGTVTVPLDHRRPHGPTIGIAIAKLPATDQARRRGALLVNPGGPGGGGRYLPEYLVSLFGHRPEMFARYDLIGFDPRFVGESTPITCGLPAHQWDAIRWADVTDLDGEVRRAREIAASCARNAGWALPYAGTDDAARDMDRIRVALGEQRISYLGYSYGTTLGRAYLGLFPNRADRFVLDSNTDPSVTRQREYREFGPNFERMLGLFSTFAAANHGRYQLGTDAVAVRRTVDAVIARAAVSPIPSGDEVWPVADVRLITFRLLYAENRFEWLGRFLDALNRAAALPENVAWLTNLRAPDTSDAGSAIFHAINCKDSPYIGGERTFRRDFAADAAAYPFAGAMASQLVAPCVFWPRFAALPRLQSDRPGLMVQSIGDPATPFQGAVRTQRDHPNLRMVTVDASHHAVFGEYPNTCVEDTVSAWLNAGTLPRRDLAC